MSSVHLIIVAIIVMAIISVPPSNAEEEGEVVRRFVCFKVITPFGYRLVMSSCRRVHSANNAGSTELNLFMSENQLWALRRFETEDLARRLAAEIRAYDILKKAGIPRSKMTYLANDDIIEDVNFGEINLEIGY